MKSWNNSQNNDILIENLNVSSHLLSDLKF